MLTDWVSLFLLLGIFALISCQKGTGSGTDYIPGYVTEYVPVNSPSGVIFLLFHCPVSFLFFFKIFVSRAVLGSKQN